MKLKIPFLNSATSRDADIEAANARVETLRLERTTLFEQRPDGADFDATVSWKRELADLDMRIEAAEEAIVALQEAALAEVAAAKEVERARRKSDAMKLVNQQAKLAHEIGAAAERLAAQLGEMEDLRAEVRSLLYDLDTERERFPDGETSARYIPGQEVPEVRGVRVMHRASSGHRPVLWRGGPGDREPTMSYGVERVTENAIFREALTIPGRNPAKYGSEIHLVDFAGRQIWPPIGRVVTP